MSDSLKVKSKQASVNNRDIARDLYLSGYSQKAIALKLKVSEMTVSRWAKAGTWVRLRRLRVPREKIIEQLYAELDEINKAIMQREEGCRYASRDESLVRKHIVDNIAKMKEDYDLRNVIDVGKDFTNFIARTDFIKSQEVMRLYDAFVDNIITKITSNDDKEIDSDR